MGVLRALAETPSGVGVTQLAGILGIGKSSAHLLLATLGDQDFVIKGPDGRYYLGPGAFEVGVAAGGVATYGGLLTPALRKLAELSGEAVSLASATGRDALIVQRVESASMLRAEIRVGTRMPLHSSASGKFLLSCMPDERIDQLYPDEELPQITEHNVRTKKMLRKQLVDVKRQGYARNKDEYAVGISGVATGVVDATGSVVFALSIAGPSHRFKPERWIKPLRATADAMSRILNDLAPVVVPRSRSRDPVPKRPRKAGR